MQSDISHLRTQTRTALRRVREALHDLGHVLPAGYTSNGTPVARLDDAALQSPTAAAAAARPIRTPRTPRARSWASPNTQKRNAPPSDPVIDLVLGPQIRQQTPSIQIQDQFSKTQSRDARSPSPTSSRPRFNNSPRVASPAEKEKLVQRVQSRIEHSRAARRSPSPIFQFHNERLKYSVEEALRKDDDYYKDMQQFRALHPDLCTNEVEARSPERTAHMYKHYTRDEPLGPKSPKQSDPLDIDDREVDTEYYMTGFFTINDRLFPERATHTPFMNNEGLLATEEPPVKVSIPLSKLQTQAKVYKAHRRNSFDPTESMNIAAHLHKGYETAGALSNKSKFSDGRVAMQDHIRKKKPNIVSFF